MGTSGVAAASALRPMAAATKPALRMPRMRPMRGASQATTRLPATVDSRNGTTSRPDIDASALRASWKCSGSAKMHRKILSAASAEAPTPIT
ncbi:hypothetical protein D3C71_1975600 [compost metagenome]